MQAKQSEGGTKLLDAALIPPQAFHSTLQIYAFFSSPQALDAIFLIAHRLTAESTSKCNITKYF